MGQYALIGIFLILLDFILLALGLGLTRGSFEYEDMKIAGPIWFILLMFGIVLLIIP